MTEYVKTPGYVLCIDFSKYKLYDLKYNMQHLLARISYATNPRAALKFLDAAIKTTEA